jgi:ABC-type branched-subunit amino acid transport system ATPase component
MLEISGLSHNYGLHRALDDIQLRIGLSEVVVILGANGAGKSTLLKCIAGIVSPVSGSKVCLEGQDLLALSAHEVVESGVAFVPEGRGIFGDLTVQENLSLGAYACRAREKESERLSHVLDIFPKLSQRMSQTVSTMSGGEQQMVAIGRALMSSPSVLLLDEPSLGLSPLMTGELFRAIDRVRTMGLSVLLVEQNASKSLAIADRGYLLGNGRVLGQGSARELARDPAVQAAYLGAASRAESVEIPA